MMTKTDHTALFRQIGSMALLEMFEYLTSQVDEGFSATDYAERFADEYTLELEEAEAVCDAWSDMHHYDYWGMAEEERVNRLLALDATLSQLRTEHVEGRVGDTPIERVA